MELSKEEENALNGEQGEAIASAYRILAAIGEATGAKKLIPVKWVHLSGVNYNTIGDAGLKFLDRFSSDAKVAVKTTVNPMGFDRSRPGKISGDFIAKQMDIVKSYERMGVSSSFTCTPYDAFDLPGKGTAVSFAESNAAIFSNSMLGLMTNKESALSALASSVTGKAPYSDLRIEESRKPKVAIEANIEVKTELDFGLLGYFAGKAVNDSCVAFDAKREPSRTEAKALSAALGTSGSCGMFTLGSAKEKISFGKNEAQSVKDELNTAEDGDIITFGSPQAGLAELSMLANLLDGKKFTKRCMIFCSRAIHNQATKAGITNRIEKSGVEFLCDCCTCLTPYVTKDDVDSVITNSIKGAYYLNNSNKVNTALKDMKTIVKEYTS